MNNSFNYHKSDFHHTRSPTHNTTFITTKFPTLSQSTQSRRTGNALHITAPERNVIIYNLCNIQTYKHTHQKYATVHSSTGLITSEHGTRSDKFIGRLRDSLLRRPITFPARLRSHLSQLVNVSRFLSVWRCVFYDRDVRVLGSIRWGEVGAIFVLFQLSVVGFVWRIFLCVEKSGIFFFRMYG